MQARTNRAFGRIEMASPAATSARAVTASATCGAVQVREADTGGGDPDPDPDPDPTVPGDQFGDTDLQLAALGGGALLLLLLVVR